MTIGFGLKMAAAITGSVASLAAHAQSWPVKPVRIVVGFTAGNAMDIRARQFAQRIGEPLGQQVIVENKAGAGGAIAAEFVARSAPDGYTLLAATTSEAVLNHAAGFRLPYDPLRDFVPVGLITAGRPYLLANPDVPAKTVAELTSLARSKPGSVSWGHVNVFQQITAIYTQKLAGFEANTVPYKGAAPAMIDLMNGQLNLLTGYASEIVANVRAGKIRVLAYFGPERHALFPDVPTMKEAGYPALDLPVWGGIFAPASTSADIVRRLNAEIRKAGEDAELRKQMAATGSEFIAMSEAQFGQFVRDEYTKWQRMVRETGLRFDN